MAAKRYRRTTPEERARWRANQDRLERLLQKALDELGTTREELHRKLGLPEPHRRGA
jgi:antirestriction protein ArdC